MEWRAVQLPSQVSLAGLPRGIYFLQGITGNRIFARKIIKQ
ncbi:MAG: T9SS type A sorting domain-containing protein [Phaeodactylibacter sp.]|nr:T9SS type A sorting domain-containing protein [Phaeodactylibacter sp.]